MKKGSNNNNDNDHNENKLRISSPSKSVKTMHQTTKMTRWPCWEGLFQRTCFHFGIILTWGEFPSRIYHDVYIYIYICISNLMWLNLIWCHQILPDSSPRCHDCQDFCLPLLGGFHWTSKPCAEIPSVSSPLHSKWWSRENLLKRASGVRIRKDTSLSFLSLTVPLDTSLSFHILGIIYIYCIYIHRHIMECVFLW